MASRKVLVAEDDRFLASAYRVKLTKKEFEVKIAADGIEVFELLKTFTPDVILLDLIMPRKDGFSVLAELRKSEKYKTIPVVVASNLGQKEDVEKALAMGADSYIIKNETTMESIVDKIKALTKS